MNVQLSAQKTRPAQQARTVSDLEAAQKLVQLCDRRPRRIGVVERIRLWLREARKANQRKHYDEITGI